MKTSYLLTAAAILLFAASNASAAQVCGFATCTSTTTNTTTITQGNTQTQVQACTGNIIVQVSMGDSNACSGWNQTAANCQTSGWKPDCGGANPGVISLPGGGGHGGSLIGTLVGVELGDGLLDGVYEGPGVNYGGHLLDGFSYDGGQPVSYAF
jgi:hypothetical protein